MTEAKTPMEIDALVESAVFGFEWPANRCRVCGWTFATTMDLGCTPASCAFRPPQPNERADNPAPYSSRIAASKEIIQRMQVTAKKRYVGDHGALLVPGAMIFAEAAR